MMEEDSHMESGLGSPGADLEETPRPTKRRRISLRDASNTALEDDIDPKLISALTLENAEDEPEDSSEMDHRKQMLAEKALYPGADSWAEEEERLFEVLFMREDRPLLPPHWNVDFRGVPISDKVFKTSDERPPLIYAHSDNEFLATMTLMRLVDLTSAVRATTQSGHRDKVPFMIKKGLDRMLRWAAEDGGYANLRTVPNIITEIIDTNNMRGNDMSEHMQERMKALCRLQREFLRSDPDPRFWHIIEPYLLGPENSFRPRLLNETKATYEKLTTSESGVPSLVDSTSEAPDTPTTPKAGTKRRHSLHDSESDTSDTNHGKTQSAKKKSRFGLFGFGRSSGYLSEDSSSDFQPESATSEIPDTPSELLYARQPPVTYGLFILNSSVFLLTADSAKGEEVYVSFHVDMDFMDRHQSVWNALTVAIAVCMARDELMTRVEDFDELPEVEDSDPDA